MGEEHPKKRDVHQVKPSHVPVRPQNFQVNLTGVIPDIWPSDVIGPKSSLIEQLTTRFRNPFVLFEARRDAPTSITFVNEAFEQTFGFTRVEVVGKNLQILLGTKSDPAIVRKIQDAMKRRAPLTEPIFLYDKKGREHWIDLELFTLIDEMAKGEYLAMALRPIADGRVHDDDSRLSGERFSQAFEYGPNGMALVAPDGQWLTVNRQLCGLLGYSAEEMGQRTFQRMTHPEDLALELAHATQAITGAMPYYQMEKRYYRKDGEIVWAHLTASLVRDNEGHPLYFIQQVQDITESKRATEKIAQQAALLDETYDAIVLFGLDGNVQFWNRGAENIYGWTPDEAQGRPALEMLYGKTPERFTEGRRTTLATGKWTNESPVVHKSGREFAVESHWTLVKDATEQPKAFLVISHDVTERKSMEAQLMRAQRMESIGTLAGGIAHDLNNILTPIMMSIEMLKATSTHPKALSIIETIESISRRGADIVRQVLSFARGMKGQHVEVQPRHLLKDIQAFIKETLPKNIQLKYRFPNDSWTILGDPTQLHQIIMNLCVNARDAMPNGGSLTITTENTTIDEQYASMHLEAKPGKYVAMLVSDTGTGIPPEILDKIFDPFFTTKEIGKGTGLGLSTVISIVKSHGGFLNVESEVGKGTTFKIYLPALEISVREDEVEKTLLNLPRGNGETVLIVDDESSILSITGQTLEAFGYKVLTATDGSEAIARYAENRDRIAVVLTDMAMPVLDGPATIRVLMKMNPEVKIIAASGLKSNAAIQETNPEIKYFIEKPYTAGTLLKTLRDILAPAA
jgi:PAS domain S-box-containing protein